MGLEWEFTGLAMPGALNDDYSVVGHMNLVGGGSAPLEGLCHAGLH